MANLESVCVGDKIVYNTMMGQKVAVVSRLTSTQVIVDNSLRFNKETGWRIGASGFNATHAYIPSKSDIETIAKKERIRDLNNWIYQLKVNPENLEMVEKFYSDITANSKKVTT